MGFLLCPLPPACASPEDLRNASIAEGDKNGWAAVTSMGAVVALPGAAKDPVKSVSCVELFRCPLTAFDLPRQGRLSVLEEFMKQAGPDGFEKDSLLASSELSVVEEVAVVAFFLALLSGPFTVILGIFSCLAMGHWKALFTFSVFSIVLAKHWLPSGPRSWLAKTTAARWLARALFRYFSIRFVWSDDAKAEFMRCPPSIAFCPPHGVLPIAGLLAIPAVNTFARPDAFVGTAASVVFSTPFLRYVTSWGAVEVGRASVLKSLKSGDSVGIIPDGIAGIFTVNAPDEVINCLKRKGIARLALQTGTAVIPSYAIGNTEIMQAWFDPFGIFEKLSRRFRTSLFLPIGRWGLPIPRRANVTMLFGAPIFVEKRPSPTDAEIAALHERILREVAGLFERHKAALGWGEKRLLFV